MTNRQARPAVVQGQSQTSKVPPRMQRGVTTRRRDSTDNQEAVRGNTASGTGTYGMLFHA